MSATVYLLTMVGVYDHGSGGVFSTREAAEAHAGAEYADSDQHHQFRIDEIRMDVPIWHRSRGRPGGRPHHRLRPLDTEFVSWEQIAAASEYNRTTEDQ